MRGEIRGERANQGIYVQFLSTTIIPRRVPPTWDHRVIPRRLIISNGGAQLMFFLEEFRGREE